MLRWLIFWGWIASATAAAARADETLPPQFTVENGELKLPGKIYFEVAGDKLKPESDAPLRLVKNYLDATPAITLLRIAVHSDAMGSADYNQKLTERRALAVARFLVAAGVDCARLIPVGFGATRPICGNDTADCRAKSRRTTFVAAALRGRPVGGLPVDGGGRVAGDPCR